MCGFNERFSYIKIEISMFSLERLTIGFDDIP